MHLCAWWAATNSKQLPLPSCKQVLGSKKRSCNRRTSTVSVNLADAVSSAILMASMGGTAASLPGTCTRSGSGGVSGAGRAGQARSMARASAGAAAGHCQGLPAAWWQGCMLCGACVAYTARARPAPCSAPCQSGATPSAAGPAPPLLLLLGWPPGPPATPPSAPPHPRLLRGAARAAAAAAARGRRCPGRAPLRGRAAPALAPRCRPPSCQACGAMRVAGGGACGGPRLHAIPGHECMQHRAAAAACNPCIAPCGTRSCNCSGATGHPPARVGLGWPGRPCARRCRLVCMSVRPCI